MPRTARIEVEGGIHHVTLRGNNGRVIFRDERERSFFLEELDVAARRYNWAWLSYCLMSNHGHLVIETPERTLGLGMRQLASRHAQALNQRYGTYGHVFQGRYGSVLVDSDVYFAQLLRYVALNPVTAGLCSDPTQWRWSSHRSLLIGSPEAINARARVETLLEGWGGPYGSRYERLFDPAGELARIFGADSPWTHRPPLVELLAAAAPDGGIRAAREHGYRLAEIAAALGVHESTVSRRLRGA
jgi:REP element-mobilizing transposase RayT